MMKGYSLGLLRRLNKHSFIAFLPIALCLSQQSAAQVTSAFHNVGDSLDKAHATGTRWKGAGGFFGDLTSPTAAVLWFNGDGEARETIVLPSGHMTLTRVQIADTDKEEKLLERRAMEKLAQILPTLPDGSFEGPLSDRIRVSWKKDDRWVSQVYSRANPPQELVALHKAVGARFYFLCPPFNMRSGPHSPEISSVRLPLLGAATLKGLFVTRSDGKTIQLNSSGNARTFPDFLSPTNQYKPWILTFDVTPDGTKAIYPVGDTLLLVELETGRELWRRTVSGRSIRVKLSPDASGLLVYNGQDVDLYNTATQDEPKHLMNETLIVKALDWSSDGKLIAWDEEGVIKIADSNGSVKQSILFREGVQAIAFSPDNTKLAVLPITIDVLEIAICDVASGKILQQVPLWVKEYLSMEAELEWSPDAKFLVARHASGLCIITDLEKNQPVAFHEKPLACAVAFDSKGREIIAIGPEYDTRLLHVPRK